MKTSAGTVLFRKANSSYELLIVQGQGNGYWSIPKGTIEPGELPEETARRETWEECGFYPPEVLNFLGDVVYSSKKKKVYAFMAEITGSIKLKIDGREITEARFCSFKEAKELLQIDQRRLVDKLESYLQFQKQR